MKRGLLTVTLTLAACAGALAAAADPATGPSTSSAAAPAIPATAPATHAATVPIASTTAPTRPAMPGTRPAMAPPAAGLPAFPAVVRDEPQEQQQARLKWFREARFGMFIHWGVYAVPAGFWQGRPVTAEWIMHRARIPVADYKALANDFTASKYDPKAWAALAREAGMKYVVITAKHHDGFALYDSQVSDWNAVKSSAAKRDLLQPLAEAVRAQGLKFGTYYSQAQDWVNPGGSKGTATDWDEAQRGSFDDYLAKVALPQVREIVQKFRPDILWWDTEYQMTPERARPFFDLVVSEPHVIHNSRLGGGVLGDFRTSEQRIPSAAMVGRALEVNMTINRSWGYRSDDVDWKSAQQLIRNLSDVASLGGNYLLNVGPTKEGEIPEPCIERLKAIGRWLSVNGEAIYGTEGSPFAKAPAWGRATRKARPDGGETLYLHVWQWPADGRIVLPGMRQSPTSSRLLAGGKPVEATAGDGGVVVTLPGPATDPDVSVVALEFGQAVPVEPPAPTTQRAPATTAAAPAAPANPAATAPSGRAPSPRQMERLGRGVVAVNQGDGKVFVSWRMLGTEPENVAFNLYRSVAGAEPVKLNGEPLTKATCYQDAGVNLTKGDLEYFVRPVIDGKEGEISKPFLSKVAATVPAKNYFSVPLKTPEGRTPNDCSVGDLDGDGEYEIVVHMTGRARDNSAAGMTDPPIFHAYKLDGTLLWTIDLGKNIREGAHYTQFLVADFDGDGRAEMFCKTADGTVDGAGKVIGDPNADWVAKEGVVAHRDTTGSERNPDGSRQTNPDGTNNFSLAGRILSGPEYLTVFDGLTGKELATADYVPSIGNINDWGDAYGNRSERYVAAAAYLDGKLPSAVMCRGYYGKSVLAAWNWRDGKLTHVWTFDTHDPARPENRKFAGQGNHGCSVADVDGDGRDEIVYGSMCVDDDGKGLWSAGLGHGDALHVGDFDPSRPGLEVFGIHEGGRQPGAAMIDARTGEVLWKTENRDTGRGLAADIDPTNPGAENWGGPGGLRNNRGQSIQGPRTSSANFAVWWDGDLLRELLSGNQVDKPGAGVLLNAQDCTSNNGTKSTPALSGDLFGDWREEVMLRTTDNRELRIFTTTIPTEHRFHTLMHDPQYRMAIAWQNVAYNQPPHPSFFIGHDMKPAPRPNITTENTTPAK